MPSLPLHRQRQRRSYKLEMQGKSIAVFSNHRADTNIINGIASWCQTNKISCYIGTDDYSAAPLASALRGLEGHCIGFATAKNVREHCERFRQPLIDCRSFVFTGMDTDNRNRLMAQSADAVVVVSRSSAPVPILTALDDVTVIALLMDGIPTTRSVARMISGAHVQRGSILFDSDILTLLRNTKSKLAETNW